MATIKELVERIETRLFLVAGLDVQIHAEDQIIEMVRHQYNTLFDDVWLQDYSLFMSATLDGSTGQITTDISSLVLRYQDIHTIFWDEDEVPLPRVTPGTNPNRIRTRCVMPSGASTSVFKLIPVDTTGQVHFWYRTKIADSVWNDNEYNTQINFDDELILLGVVYEFLALDDSNPSATNEYKSKFAGRLKQMREAQWNFPLSKRKLERDGPLTRWE